MSEAKRVLVIAATFQEFQSWKRKYGELYPNARYVNADHDLLGFRVSDLLIVLTGRYWLSAVLGSQQYDYLVQTGVGVERMAS